MWGGINRRKFPRASYRCLIQMSKKDSTKSISTHTENIGSGGICVIIKDNLGLFQGVNLEVILEDSNVPIKCSGTVVWVVKKRAEKLSEGYMFDTGIEFVGLSEKDISRIEQIIKTIIEKESPSP